jgi:hypothetical protein
MRLTDAHRELIERALDAMALRARCREKPTFRELRDYERAVALVRERPAGERRLRSDFNGLRSTAQTEIPTIEPPID